MSNNRKAVRIGSSRARFEFEGSRENDNYINKLYDGIESDLDYLCRNVLIDPASVAIDVGANVGVTASVLSTQLKLGHVHAIEAGPRVYAALKRNIERNCLSNVSAHNFAVSDECGQVNFREDDAWGQVRPDGVSVPAISIDVFVENLGLNRVDFIKIDVEGFEDKVLDGAQKTIAQFNPLIQIEFNIVCLIDVGLNPYEASKKMLAPFRYRFILDQPPVRIPNDDTRTFVHDRIVEGGGLDDLLLTNNEDFAARITSAPKRRYARLALDAQSGWRQIGRQILKTAGRLRTGKLPFGLR